MAHKIIYQNLQAILLIALLLFSNMGLAKIKPIQYTATYRIYVHGFQLGRAQRQLTVNKNGEYELAVETHSNLPLIKYHTSEYSQGILQAQKVEPQVYWYTEERFGKTFKQQLIFDWQHLKATASGTIDKIFSISPPLQDKLSYQLALKQALFKHTPRFQFSFIDEDTIKTYRFTLKGEETLSSRLGNIETIRIERNDPIKNRQTTLWVAKNLNNILVKIEDKHNGKVQNHVEIDTLTLFGQPYSAR